jgi:predicted nucleotidyltransferase/plasmid maintenance system antidote protein VapI
MSKPGNFIIMDSFGQIIRKLREGKKLPLRIIAEYLGIDQAILSKIERGRRRATKEQVLKLAGYFKVKKNDLIVAWLSDKLAYEVKNEEMGLNALQAAEEMIGYGDFDKPNKSKIMPALKDFFLREKRINKAWLFGSLARNTAVASSDIDVMIEMNDAKKYTLLDVLDIQYQLQKILKRKVDLVERECLKPFALQSVRNDLQLIIEK